MAVHTNTDGRTTSAAAYVDRRLVGAGAALMAGGLLACLVGATVGMVAVATACRRYVADLDEPPRELARRRLRQARSATMAGVGAWQDYARQARTDAVH
jgi:hypothetical protein